MVPSVSNPAVAPAVGFARGFRAFFLGLRFVYRDHPRLLFFFLPVCLIAALFVALEIGLFVWLIDWLLGLFTPSGTGFWARLAGVLLWLFQVLFVLTAVLAAIFLGFLLFPVFTAPFNDFLSEQIEGLRGTFAARPFSFICLLTDLGRSIALAFRRLFRKIVWLVPMFALSFVPVAGPVLWLLGGGYFLSKETGFDLVDACLARRGESAAVRLRFSDRHRFALAGLGTAVLLAELVPIVLPLVWPGAVAGGAILFDEIQASE